MEVEMLAFLVEAVQGVGGEVVAFDDLAGGEWVVERDSMSVR